MSDQATIDRILALLDADDNDREISPELQMAAILVVHALGEPLVLTRAESSPAKLRAAIDCAILRVVLDPRRRTV